MIRFSFLFVDEGAFLFSHGFDVVVGSGGGSVGLGFEGVCVGFQRPISVFNF